MRKYAKLIIICVIIFYTWCFFRYVTTPIRTDVVRYGLIEDVENTTGYVIRDEQVVQATASGNLDMVAKEGERVAKGGRIATIYKGQVDSNVQENIKRLNERMAEIGNNQLQKDLFASDLTKLESQINGKVNEVVNVSYTHKSAKLSQIKTDINKILDKKLTVSGDKGPSGNNLEALRKEKESYESQLQAAKVDLYAQKSGNVSYSIDGMEQALSFGSINQLTPVSFEALDKMQSSQNVGVISGQPVAKIVNNFEWYIAVEMESKKLNNLKTGDSVAVRFPDNGEAKIDASVYYISQEDKGKVVMVIRVNEYIESIFSQRKITSVDIIKHSYSGFKIPTTAIRVNNGKTGVFVDRESIARFKEVEVIYKSNDFSIIKENNLNDKGVLLYDKILVKSDNIYDGKLID